MQGLRHITIEYPHQFWVLFGGLLVSSIGNSMIWPFLTLYMRQRLDEPLTTVGFLFSLSSAAGLVTTFIAGPAIG